MRGSVKALESEASEDEAHELERSEGGHFCKRSEPVRRPTWQNMGGEENGDKEEEDRRRVVRNVRGTSGRQKRKQWRRWSEGARFHKRSFRRISHRQSITPSPNAFAKNFDIAKKLKPISPRGYTPYKGAQRWPRHKCARLQGEVSLSPRRPPRAPKEKEKTRNK